MKQVEKIGDLFGKEFKKGTWNRQSAFIIVP